MHLVSMELRRIALDLVTPFRTSFGVEEHRDILLLRLVTDAGVGWGECVAMVEPAYSSEFVNGAELVLTEHFWPALVAGGDLQAADVAHRLHRYKGHPMAKAALEMAVLDAELRAEGTNLHTRFGGARDRVPSGVSVGIFDDLDTLLSQVQGYVDDGYARIKLKIEPGWDIEPVRLVRELIGPEMGLQVDANTAYGRHDIEHLCRLDEFDLLLIEQPLAEEDVLGHVQLAAAAVTPICLDESVVSLQTAADLIELGAAEIINIKPGRVGGYLEARRIHDLCLDRGVPVWCGGMVETGIGRAANAAIAALPGFTLAGDISASSRFYARALVTAPLTVAAGSVAVPGAAGLGYELDHDYVDSITTRSTILTA
ncbi:MAG: o-succinylbenzoate synthase [Ilumatobacteraceae bacterium]